LKARLLDEVDERKTFVVMLDEGDEPVEVLTDAEGESGFFALDLHLFPCEVAAEAIARNLAPHARLLTM
jgi:hypothetical protein